MGNFFRILEKLKIQRKTSRSGQVLPWSILMMGLLLGAVALSLTIGTVYWAHGRLQNAVDAAALAGAQAVADGDPNAPADQIAMLTQNWGQASGTVEMLSADERTVQASASAQVPGGFAGLFGISHFTVHARAVARWGPGPAFDYALFQGSNIQPLDLGPGTITGNVHANNCVTTHGNPDISGTVTVSAPGSGCMSGVVTVPPITLSDWTLTQLKAVPGVTVLSSEPAAWTQSGAVITGTYVVTGDVTLTHAVVNGSIVAYGGNLLFDGGVDGTNASSFFTLAAMKAGGAGGDLQVNGGARINGGVLYAPEGTITINGGGNTDIVGAVVANVVVVHGKWTLSHPGAGGISLPVARVQLIQ